MTPPLRPVYRALHVGMATLLGGPFAGGMLLGLSAARCGRPTLAWAVVGGSLALCLGGVSLGDYLSLPYGLLPVAFALAMGSLTASLVGDAVAASLVAGHPDGSLVGFATAVLLGIAVTMAWAAAT